jgi:hypothetical protein
MLGPVNDRARNPTQMRPGGWLLLLCGMLLIWQPLSTGISASRVLNSLPLAGSRLVVILLARLAVTALGVSAGLALMGRRPGAITLTQISLIVSLAVDLFIYATPYFPSNRGPGETPWWVAGSITYCGFWLLYLNRSRHVRALFARRPDGENGSTGG